MSRGLDALIGAWQLAGIYRWNTGLPNGQPYDTGQWSTNWEVQSNVMMVGHPDLPESRRCEQSAEAIWVRYGCSLSELPSFVPRRNRAAQCAASAGLCGSRYGAQQGVHSTVERETTTRAAVGSIQRNQHAASYRRRCHEQQSVGRSGCVAFLFLGKVAGRTFLSTSAGKM
jgi:hypothetical protein